MKILFVSRSNFLQFKGGDTTQVLMTAQELEKLGVQVSFYSTDSNVDVNQYDLIHFFNITRPAAILSVLGKSKIPYVVSTIYVDYSFYSKYKKWSKMGIITQLFGADGIEYFKALAKHFLRKERIEHPAYLWKGQKRSIATILSNASYLLPNSENEFQRLKARYPQAGKYAVIPNGVALSPLDVPTIPKRKAKQVLCAAMIEPRKNQLNLIRAVKDSDYQLILVGQPAPNQRTYFEKCKKEAGANVQFIGRLEYEELSYYYLESEIHVLPSWFETTGLSSLEAAFFGCKIVVTRMGDTQDYFEDMVHYCHPRSTLSIRKAIDTAHANPVDLRLKEKIITAYNWKNTAEQTKCVYAQITAEK
jgi:glycosyltransferase involved in cell wall biosynthesis